MIEPKELESLYLVSYKGEEWIMYWKLEGWFLLSAKEVRQVPASIMKKLTLIKDLSKEDFDKKTQEYNTKSY